MIILDQVVDQGRGALSRQYPLHRYSLGQGLRILDQGVRNRSRHYPIRLLLGQMPRDWDSASPLGGISEVGAPKKGPTRKGGSMGLDCWYSDALVDVY